MTTYEIGDKTIVLEDISCIDTPFSEDANRITCYVWLRHSLEKIRCTIHAVDKEQSYSSSGKMYMGFYRRALNEFEEFKKAFININKDI